MPFYIQDSQTGWLDKFASILDDNLPGFGSDWYQGGSRGGSLDESVFWQDIRTWGRAYTHLSYDPQGDYLIVTNGESWTTPAVGGHIDYYGPTGVVQADGPLILQTLIAAGDLDPEVGIEEGGMTGALWGICGLATGFTLDHTTGTFYAANGSRLVKQSRAVPVGDVPFFAFDEPFTFIGRQRYIVSELLSEAAMNESLNYQVNRLAGATLAARPYPIKGSTSDILVTPVVMDDVVAYAYAQFPLGGMISLVKRDAAGTYVSTRPIDMAHILGLFPLGIDQFMMVGFIGNHNAGVTTGQTAPLIALTWRYNRTSGQLELDDIAEVPTTYAYNWPKHVGYITFDTKRQMLILFDPEQDSFERHVFNTLCHPVGPNTLAAPTPLDPIHAGQKATFKALVAKDIAPTAAVTVDITYSGIETTTFTQQATTVKTSPVTGVGTFDVGFASAAEGSSFSVEFFLSTFSVAVCNTVAEGTLYGADPVALTGTSATFTVSATLSASLSATSLTTSAIILAKKPLFLNDAGGGTPRELDHPVSGSFPSPFVYELNPQMWEGMLDEVLQRPLYASVRTLEQTVTIQYDFDITDTEIKEQWMGGGNRIAMSLSQFTTLYDYFTNPPVFASQGFILWRPRDVSNKVFQVLITSLTVGGSDAYTLDRLAAQGDGWVHEAVEMTMRIVAEV